jgi:hypothetical protein
MCKDDFVLRGDPTDQGENRVGICQDCKQVLLVAWVGVLTAGIGSIVGLLWKRHAIITVIKYSDDTSEPQTMDLDFMHNTNMLSSLWTERCERPEDRLVMMMLNL